MRNKSLIHTKDIKTQEVMSSCLNCCGACGRA